MKILVCGVSDVDLPWVMFNFSICYISFIFLFLSSLLLFISGFYFVLNDLKINIYIYIYIVSQGHHLHNGIISFIDKQFFTKLHCYAVEVTNVPQKA
jgi:hypothetical protein